MSHRDNRADQSLEARAMRRVRRKMGFFIHAFVFVCVNVGLYALNQMTGGVHWHQFPLLGWGLGLAIHGMVTFASLQGVSLREQMLKAEVERLKRLQA